MGFYEDLERSLQEAIAIEAGQISMEKKEGMPAPTFVASDKEKKLIDEIVRARKSLNMSQVQLANLTGNKQQTISRMEKNEHSPSLRTICNIVNALGYELKLVKNV